MQLGILDLHQICLGLREMSFGHLLPQEAVHWTSINGDGFVFERFGHYINVMKVRPLLALISKLSGGFPPTINFFLFYFFIFASVGVGAATIFSSPLLRHCQHNSMYHIFFALDRYQNYTFYAVTYFEP